MAARWCERMAMLDGGRKVEDGSSHQLLRAPRSDVGQRLVASARAREGGRTPQRPDRETVLRVEEMRCWHAIGGMPWAPRLAQSGGWHQLQLLRAGEKPGGCRGLRLRQKHAVPSPDGTQPHPRRPGDLLGQDLLSLRGAKLRCAGRRPCRWCFRTLWPASIQP